MADTFPICSIIVAKASGTMVMVAVMASPLSKFSPKREKTVFSQVNGRPIQEASATSVKSTSPSTAASA